MLQVLEGSELENIAAICVRYFGGVKLGTGGLARAYSGATVKALEAAGSLQLEARATFQLILPFDLLGLRGEIEALFPKVNFSGDFGERGWQGTLDLPEDQVERLRSLLADKAKGMVTLKSTSL
jgi:putative IMPACT (imprinted ancient) family translation regulator